MQIKIGNKIFYCIDGNVQLSLGSHATINLKFDINKYPEYENIFIKLYESDSTFKLISSKFTSDGSRIKSIDIDFNNKKIELLIHSDVLDTKEISNRREDTINDILKKTFKFNKDIIL